MSDKGTRKTKSRTRTIECLEERHMMSADPIAQLLGGAVQPNTVDAAPALVQHELGEPDFWIDPVAERSLDDVSGQLDEMIANADSLTGLSQVRNTYGFTGAGQTVAVIDSGIAWDHYALGGGLGANYRVIGGWDFTENDANPYDDGLYGSHGTHVSGIIGGDRPGTIDDGVAPGVSLVGLRVFNDAGQGYFNWVESALQWVHQNRNAFASPITTVNLSLGTSWNDTTIPNWTTMEDEFAQLKADGIFIAVSAGNSFTSYNTPGLSYPAASPYVVPVMSVDDSGSLSYFSQRQARAIAAPGRGISSTVPDYAGNHNGIADDYATMSGTSMASPYIAGASVLIRQAMQTAGYTNINEDTIYNTMMSTATSIFDAATNQSYKRINLANAINSIMTTDDYGSTVATAANLGQITGTSQIHGTINNSADVDYFRFTAGSTGTVSFTMTTHDNVRAAWNATGGAVSGAQGETYTFQVVAGQSYTIGLASSSGVGQYDLAVNATTPFTFTDWGTITQLQTNNVANSGVTWYKVRACQTGYFTAEALFSAAGGNIDITLCNTSRQALAGGVATGVGKRAEMLVTAGTEYFLCVAGSNADVDLRVTNLVSKVGTTVSVGGTSAADAFTFTIGATQHSFSINGTTYQFAKTAVTAINFYGGGGNDSITMTGTAKPETADLRVGAASLTGMGISAMAIGIEYVTVNSGGGKDVLRLYDSAGDDLFQAYKGYAVMSGSGYSSMAVGFTNATAYASAGNDTAHFYDSAGNDTFRSYADHAEMKGVGYLNTAYGFDNKFGHASSGIDKAYLYDTAGNDTLNAYVDHSTMTGGGYSSTASGFDQTYAYASNGYDVAQLYDSAGNDVYKNYPTRASMTGPGYSNTVYGFDSALGHLTTGLDSARQYSLGVADENLAEAVPAASPAAVVSNTATGVERSFASTLKGVDRAPASSQLATNSVSSKAFEDYSVVDVKQDTHGFDDAVLASITTDTKSIDEEALDQLFDQLSKVS